ncbi:MAG TPA: hypothetical protein VK154_20300 [Chitinophagales bacterium]|nr:hypothetical protein [Chitinophagales bacterium]
MVQLSIYLAKPVLPVQIEDHCAKAGLTLTMQGSLKSIAPNTHWHFKKGKQKGVLEITLMHQTGEIILSVHQNRRGGWEDEMMRSLQAQLV